MRFLIFNPNHFRFFSSLVLTIFSPAGAFLTREVKWRGLQGFAFVGPTWFEGSG